MNRLLFTAVATVCCTTSIHSQEFFVKELVFPADADSVAKIEMAGRVVPSAQQLAWQQRPLTAFLHFGMNTFTDREWGDGKESPQLFNPTKLDTDQWVKTLKDAGFEMVILTAKHHDGFCLWPTSTTSHSVASSAWRDGKGDVVADLRRSCDKYGMKLGLYLSPWDRNAQCYGSEEYNDMFVAQLTELLSNYGKVDEVWFDGACGEGPNGKKQVYDWLRYRETMRRLQPEAVLAITGDDVRWVGNEGGCGRETEWSVTPLVPSIFSYADSVNSSLGIDAMSPLIGSREMVAKADRLYWWPSEVDVSIRPGWFYHDNEQPHSMDRMAKIYLESVGRNSTLLLNVPPNAEGLISPSDCERLVQFHDWIQANFHSNDQNKKTDGINCVELREDITKGQRVESFEVLGMVNGQWQKITEGTTIGNCRLLTFDPVIADSLMLNVTASRGEPYARIADSYHIRMPELIRTPQQQVEYVSRYPEIEATPLITMASTVDAPEVTIGWSKKQEIAGFIYTPDRTGGGDVIYHYAVQVSNDMKKWKDVEVNGEFGNIKANPIPHEVVFGKPVKARAIRIICRETADGNEYRPELSQFTILAPIRQ